MLSLFTKLATNNLQTVLPQKTNVFKNIKYFSLSSFKYCAEKIIPADIDQEEIKTEDPKRTEKDRTQIIPVEKSIKYIKSAAYKETYGDQFVWEQYRRNHKGQIPPRKTRKTCIRKGQISTGNPCPICRDEYLVLDHRNIELLQQFLSPQTGEVISYTKTGLCQNKHQQLLVAVERAMDCGYLTFDVPFRKYDYSEYYGKN